MVFIIEWRLEAAIEIHFSNEHSLHFSVFAWYIRRLAELSRATSPVRIRVSTSRRPIDALAAPTCENLARPRPEAWEDEEVHEEVRQVRRTRYAHAAEVEVAIKGQHVCVLSRCRERRKKTGCRIRRWVCRTLHASRPSAPTRVHSLPVSTQQMSIGP